MPTRKTKQKGAAAIAKLTRQLEVLKVEYMPLTALRPNHYNPNRQNDHEFTMLVKSMQDAGFVQPITAVEVLDDDDWRPEVEAGHYRVGDVVIVDGEHRWRAAAHLDMTEIPVVKVPFTVAQAKVSTLQMNRARGSEDVEKSTEVLRDLERMGQLDWAADSLDMSDEELDRLLADIAPPDALAGEEFSEAWTPAGGGINADGQISATATADHTPAALEAARDQETRLREARSEEERQMIQRDGRLFRLVLSFTGEEAEVVKTALGDQPAVRILDWCRHAPDGGRQPEAVA